MVNKDVLLYLDETLVQYKTDDVFFLAYARQSARIMNARIMY